MIGRWNIDAKDTAFSLTCLKAFFKSCQLLLICRYKMNECVNISLCIIYVFVSSYTAMQNIKHVLNASSTLKSSRQINQTISVAMVTETIVDLRSSSCFPIWSQNSSEIADRRPECLANIQTEQNPGGISGSNSGGLPSVLVRNMILTW